MKCKHHPNADSIEQCAGCFAPLCGFCCNFTDDGVYCESCTETNKTSKFVEKKVQQVQQADKFEQILANDIDEADQPKSKKQSLEESIEKREKLHMSVIVLCFIFIGIRIYSTLGAASAYTASQIREQEVNRDQINSCVQVFWEIAEVLESGAEPSDSLSCTDSQLPNVITRADDDITISHPSPRTLGYSEIYIKRSNPVPMFIL